MSKSTETGVTPQGRGSHKRSLWRGQSVGHMAIVLLNYKGNLSCLAERVGFEPTKTVLLRCLPHEGL